LKNIKSRRAPLGGNLKNIKSRRAPFRGQFEKHQIPATPFFMTLEFIRPCDDTAFRDEFAPDSPLERRVISEPGRAVLNLSPRAGLPPARTSGDVDNAEQDILAVQKTKQAERHFGHRHTRPRLDRSGSSRGPGRSPLTAAIPPRHSSKSPRPLQVFHIVSPLYCRDAPSMQINCTPGLWQLRKRALSQTV
jgi:hypothetical protein